MDSAGMTFIDVWEHVSVLNVMLAFIGGLAALLALASMMQGCEKDDSDYFVISALFGAIALFLLLQSVPNAYQRGFKAKVDNVNAFSQISMNYIMTDLDENGVFTFKER